MPNEQPTSRSKLCIYCGVNPATRRGDHIPPSCLFAVSPDPPIIVPSCTDCNQGQSKEDEYFRLAITSRADVFDHPEVPSLSETVARGMARPQSRGLLEAVCQNIGMTELHSPGGIYLRDVGFMNVNLRRLDGVVARIVRGLYYHETRTPLLPTSVVTVYQDSGLRDIPTDARELVARFCAALLNQPEGKIGNDVFTYRYQLLEGHVGVSAWLLGFYQKVWFLGMTYPPGMPEK